MEDKVFGLYEDGSIVSWDVKEFNALEHIKPANYSQCGHKFFLKVNGWTAILTYLVQSGSDLLAVSRFNRQVLIDDDIVYNVDYFWRTNDFKVYRFKTEDKSWEKIEDLGEVALVVGGNSSMCVSVTHTNGLQPNCIYFTDDLDMCWLSVTKPGGHYTGVFDVKSHEIRQFYEGDDMHSSFAPPILFIPQF
ncbi:uncharacterized protein LOC141614620 [Silene latifolia]|uniref:uncharacterized protein LOC141614620 n=1 Tax=Silene latifolia TaxID=37657 RepID=UPI003D77564B